MENENQSEVVFVLDSRSKLAAALCSQVQVGKAGEHLKNGLTTDSWALFLAEYASRALNKGASVDALASYFVALGAGNMSQVRQAMEALRIGTPGGKSRSFLPTEAKAAPLGFAGSDV